jgi:hypothetical protein
MWSGAPCALMAPHVGQPFVNRSADGDRGTSRFALAPPILSAAARREMYRAGECSYASHRLTQRASSAWSAAHSTPRLTASLRLGAVPLRAVLQHVNGVRRASGRGAARAVGRMPHGPERCVLANSRPMGWQSLRPRIIGGAPLYR